MRYAHAQHRVRQSTTSTHSTHVSTILYRPSTMQWMCFYYFILFEWMDHYFMCWKIHADWTKKRHRKRERERAIRCLNKWATRVSSYPLHTQHTQHTHEHILYFSGYKIYTQPSGHNVSNVETEQQREISLSAALRRRHHTAAAVAVPSIQHPYMATAPHKSNVRFKYFIECHNHHVGNVHRRPGCVWSTL